jgi:hypothetical protein
LTLKSQSGRIERKLSFPSPKRSKALKGGAHERRRLKQTSPGFKAADTVERVAKP